MFFHLPKERDHFYLEMKAFRKGMRREEMRVFKKQVRWIRWTEVGRPL